MTAGEWLAIGITAWLIGSVFVGCKVGRWIKRNKQPRP